MIKQLSAVVVAMYLCTGLAHANAHKEAPKMASADCEAKAAEKKLAGAAKNSFVKKCSGDGAMMAKSPAAEACDKTAAEKKLAGAAKASFTKKCIADAK